MPQTQINPNADNQSKETVVPVTRWDGMMSNYPLKSLPISAWSYLLNMDYQGPFIVNSRMGTDEIVAAADTGESGILCHYEFKTSGGSIREVMANENGELMYFDLSDPATIIPIATMSNTNPTQVSMAMLKDALYIADGITGYKYDGVSLTPVVFPETAPLPLGNVVDVIATRDRIIWATDADWIIASEINDPDTLDNEALTTYKAQVSYNDGTDVYKLVRWGNTVLINKGNINTGQYAMYRIRGIGSTDDPFVIEPLFGDASTAAAFLGNSAVQIGGDVIGLTSEGVTTVSAINNFKEAYPQNISIGIDDIIQRINFDYAYKICSIYDVVTKQLLIAVPLDGSTYNNYVLILDRKMDPASGDIIYRWSLYNNWKVRCWGRIKRDVYYGGQDGNFIKTRTGHNDLGAGYQKIAEGPNVDMQYPDVVKLFKSIEVDLTHDGDYPVQFSWVIDDVGVQEKNIDLRLDPKSSLWDEFSYDVDFFDSEGSTIRNIYIMGRGKFIRPRFYNDQPDEPYSIASMSYRMVRKDAGVEKN